MPGLKYQIQSDQLVIRPYGNLLTDLRTIVDEGAPEGIDRVPEMPDIEVELDFFDPWQPDERPPSRESDVESVTFTEEPIVPPKVLGKRPAASVMSLSSDEEDDDEAVVVHPPRSGGIAPVDLDSDSDFEMVDAVPQGVALRIEDDEDDALDLPNGQQALVESEESDSEDELDELQSDDELPDGPQLEDSAVAFFTPPTTSSTGPQRKTKMRAFFDCGKRFLAVAKTGDVLAWSKALDRTCVASLNSLRF